MISKALCKSIKQAPIKLPLPTASQIDVWISVQFRQETHTTAGVLHTP